MLAEHGYDGVALTLDHVHLDPFAPELGRRVAEAARAARRSSASTCVVETGGRFVLDPRRKHHPTLLSPDPGRRIDFLEPAIDIAARLGAPVVSMWSGAAPEGLADGPPGTRLVAGCEPVLEHAERRGVDHRLRARARDARRDARRLRDLAGRLGRPPQLGLTLDLGHCVCLEPSPVDECIRSGAADLVHVHVEDMRRGEHEHLMFGEGELDTSAALAALEEIGYAGQVAVELSRHAHAAHETVPRAIEYLHAHERREVSKTN